MVRLPQFCQMGKGTSPLPGQKDYDQGYLQITDDTRPVFSRTGLSLSTWELRLSGN